MIHVLHLGVALCGLPGFPRDWAPEHAWVPIGSGGVTCPGCQAEREARWPAFTCAKCGRTSHNPRDRQEGYCGACQSFTSSTAP